MNKSVKVMLTVCAALMLTASGCGKKEEKSRDYADTGTYSNPNSCSAYGNTRAYFHTGTESDRCENNTV